MARGGGAWASPSCLSALLRPWIWETAAHCLCWDSTVNYSGTSWLDLRVCKGSLGTKQDGWHSFTKKKRMKKRICWRQGEMLEVGQWVWATEKPTNNLLAWPPEAQHSSPRPPSPLLSCHLKKTHIGRNQSIKCHYRFIKPDVERHLTVTSSESIKRALLFSLVLWKSKYIFII